MRLNRLSIVCRRWYRPLLRQLSVYATILWLQFLFLLHQVTGPSLDWAQLWRRYPNWSWFLLLNAAPGSHDLSLDLSSDKGSKRIQLYARDGINVHDLGCNHKYVLVPRHLRLLQQMVYACIVPAHHNIRAHCAQLSDCFCYLLAIDPIELPRRRLNHADPSKPREHRVSRDGAAHPNRSWLFLWFPSQQRHRGRNSHLRTLHRLEDVRQSLQRQFPILRKVWNRYWHFRSLLQGGCQPVGIARPSGLAQVPSQV